MALKFLKHKWQKITFGILLALVILVLLPALLINRYWSPILAEKVKSGVLTNTDSLYKVDFAHADLHIIKGEIVIYNIKLRPDTAVYNRKRKQGLAPNNLYELNVKKLVLSRIHPFSLYFKNKLNIGRITLSAPELQVSFRVNHTKDTVGADSRTVWQKINKSLKLIHVGEIYLNDVKFKYINYSGKKPAVSELKEMNLKATDLLIDSATQTDRSRLLYCADITTELYNYTGKSANGLYTYSVKSAKLSTKTSRLNIEGLVLQPLTPIQFFDDTKADRFTIRLDSLQVNHFDFLNYHKYRSFNAANVMLSTGTLAIYSNPNGVTQTTDRVVTFPHVAIKKIKTAFNIDTLAINDINVLYNEYNKRSKKVGTITFNNTSGQFINLTNNTDSVKKHPLATARLNTLFMERGRLRLQFTFDLTNADNSYSYKGHMGMFDLPRVNKAAMPLAMVKITSGKVNSIDFDLHATNKTTTGNVSLLYENLKVNLLRPDTANKGYSKKTLASLFANSLVIEHDNPNKPGTLPRTAYVSYVRPLTSPFFKTVWQALLSGLKPCVGLGAAKEKDVRAKMDNHEKKKIQKAIDKKERVRKRTQRRLNRKNKKMARQRRELAEPGQ
ncbi:hypothetical protein [Mucilaginibacter glaciei]|uniref:DUF748 domain-containing protein n=1 Tax=Mucilaginibacter glaciei TaxID=2772109 RepID=A0A926S1F7_9SPHI|nr:hypothetical protein [Mucilaginibacter glaciei]MBD1393985.1 hypothetical protein [Mucilaginibacter glaciei]